MVRQETITTSKKEQIKSHPSYHALPTVIGADNNMTKWYSINNKK
jgi:hypothetical protein